jgi:hypothetical protein
MGGSVVGWGGELWEVPGVFSRYDIVAKRVVFINTTSGEAVLEWT